ncbi:MAG TPA: hypothetical protein VKS79_09740 [Gemmataceae bacterium]|nr:hypothetical protein [Gemmataceae bacterium]
MSNQKYDYPFYRAVNAKLTEIAAATPTPPSWHETWASLTPQSSPQEHLAVYRAILASGSVPAEAGLFLVAQIFDLITDERAPEALRLVEEHLETIRRKYGLDEDASALGADVPPEYRKAMQRCHDEWDALYLAALEEHGEHDLARLFQENRLEFDRRYEEGRQFFHRQQDGSDIENHDWLELLLDAVTGCIEAESPMGPLGLRYCQEEGFWEVLVFPTPVELVGGACDGEVVVPDFWLNLERLREQFESVSDLGWNALGLNAPEGPYINVEGIFQGREVFLQVLAYAPEDEEPGLKLDARRGGRPAE